MFARNDLSLPQQEILLTRNTNRDSWIGHCEVFNRNPSECIGVIVRQLDRNYHYNYRLLEGSSFLLQPSGSLNDFHSFKFMVVFNDDRGGYVGDMDKVMKGANREYIERMVEKGHSVLLEDLCIVYGNVMNSADWKARLEKFAPYRANIRVRIPSLPFTKRRTILIPEVGTQNHRVNESNDILLDAAATRQEELDEGDQQIRQVLRIRKFTDFEIRAQRLFRNFTNPSEPYKAEHAEVYPNRYIQFKRETRIQLKKGKRSYNPWIGEVTIRNHAPSHYLIYKLRTTAPQHYVVMPTEGVLMPRFRRKMFSLKYETSKFSETLEHLNQTSATAENSSNNMKATNASRFGEDSEGLEAGSTAGQIQADIMMDKKFFRSSVSRSAPQNKVRCDNHRFADTQNFASLARDTLNENEQEEQADAVSIRFLYSDVIAEGEALSSASESSFWKQQEKQQAQQSQKQKWDNSNANNHDSSYTAKMLGLDFTSAVKEGGFDDHRITATGSSGTGMRESFSDLNSHSSNEVTRMMAAGPIGAVGRDEDASRILRTIQRRKELAVWLKMAATERNTEVKDEKNHVQSHVFLLDVAFVDPYAVDERNYNIEELFRHTETLTGGYKMSRCFYPYFVPEDTISGPVIVYPKNDVIIERGIGNVHAHWLTEIYLVNIYKSTLYYCIIPQEEDYGQLEPGDEILVTPKSGQLLHYSEKRKFCGVLESNLTDSLCKQIQIFLRQLIAKPTFAFRYTRICCMEDGPIFKLHIFFFTESAAPDWLRHPSDNEQLDMSNPTYQNPLSRALEVATVRIFIKDAEQHVNCKNQLSYDDFDDTDDVFKSMKAEGGQPVRDPTGTPSLCMSTSATLLSESHLSPYDGSLAPCGTVGLGNFIGRGAETSAPDVAPRNVPVRILDAANVKGIGELLHHGSSSAATVHSIRQPTDPAVELSYDCERLILTGVSYAPGLVTAVKPIRLTSHLNSRPFSSQQHHGQHVRSRDSGQDSVFSGSDPLMQQILQQKLKMQVVLLDSSQDSILSVESLPRQAQLTNKQVEPSPAIEKQKQQQQQQLQLSSTSTSQTSASQDSILSAESLPRQAQLTIKRVEPSPATEKQKQQQQQKQLQPSSTSASQTSASPVLKIQQQELLSKDSSDSASKY